MSAVRFSTRGTEFWSKTQKERGKRIKKSRRRKLAQLEQEIGEMAQDEGRVIVLNLTDEDIANRQMGMNDRTSRRIEAGLVISYYRIWGPPPLGVENVKIQENSEKIRGPLGDP